jgi:hypothetical protein
VAWSGPFGGEAFLGFRPVIVADREGRPSVTRVTVFAATPFPTALVGFWMIPSQVCSRGRVRCGRAFPLPRTHLPFAARSVAVFLLRDRPARLRSWGASCRPGVQRRASTAAKWGAGKNERRPKGRSVEDGSVRLLGFAFSACDPRVSVFVGSDERDPTLGFRLFQV